MEHNPEPVVPTVCPADGIYQEIGGILPIDLDLGRDDPMTRNEYLTMVSRQYREKDDILKNGRCLSPNLVESLEGFKEVAIELIESALSQKGFEELIKENNY